MAGPLTWELVLKDSFSPAAKKAAASIDKLEKTFDALDKATKTQADAQERLNRLDKDALTLSRQRTTQARKLAGQLDKVGKTQAKIQTAQRKSGSAGGGVLDQVMQGANAGGIGSLISFAKNGLAVAAGIGAITIAANEAAKAFTAMGKAALGVSKWAIDKLTFKESTLATMEILTGDKKTAQGLFSSAMRMAGKTPFSVSTVSGAYQKLLGAGFGADQVGTVFQGIGDVAAMNGFDESVISRMADTFAQIKGRGKFVTEEMKQAFNAGGGAITIKGVYEEIAKSMNIGADQVEKAMARGEVAASTGINAILKVIQSKSGGKVGGALLKQSGTLGGLLSTIRDIPTMLLYSLDLEGSKGFGALKGALQNVIQLFDTTSESGQRFSRYLTGIIDSLWTNVLQPLTGPEGLKKLEGLAESVFGVFKAGMKAVEGFGSGFLSALGMGSGGADWEKIGEKMAKAGETFGLIIGKTVESLAWAADFLANHETLAKLLLRVNPVAAPVATASLGSDAWNWLTSRKQGEYADGPDFAGAEGGIVDKPTRALVGEAGPEAIIPLKRSHGEGLSSLRGGIGGGGVTVNISLSVDARGNGQGEDIAQSIAAALPSALADALEGLAIEAGGAF